MSLEKWWRRSFVVAAVGGALAAVAGTAWAAVNGVEYNYTLAFSSGSQTATATAITPVTDAGKILVLQTISLYRFPASTSSLQCFVGIPSATGNTGFVAMPDIGSSTDFYPATTLNFTGYVVAKTNALMNCYRTGGAYPAETDYVTVIGNITTP